MYNENGEYILPETTVKPLPEQVDDSVISRSNVLKIFESNDPKFLDTCILRMGQITQDEQMLIKKLTITALGKKRGLFNDKVVGIVTDQSFLTDMMNGKIDIERMKMMLKFEMDNRVDNSLETRMDRGYVKFEEFEKMLDTVVERIGKENEDLKKQNKFYSTMMGHYNGRLAINGKFLGLKSTSPSEYIVECLNITGNNIANIQYDKQSTIIDYVFDYQFITIMIDQLIIEEEDRQRFFGIIIDFLRGIDIENLAASFTPETDPIYKSLPQQVRSSILYVESLMNKN